MVRGLAHRLDAETSGCLVVGTNRDSFFSLRQQCEQHYWNKQYVTLVYGRIPIKNSYGNITAPLAKDKSVGRGGKVSHHAYVCHQTGQPSETRYRVLQYFKKDPTLAGCHKGFTLVQCRIMTGRTHQIRVHMKHLGFPVVSDFIYADDLDYKSTRDFCPRVFLHHFQIEIPKPRGNWKEYGKHQCPLPNSLRHVIENVATKDVAANEELTEHMALPENVSIINEMFDKVDVGGNNSTGPNQNSNRSQPPSSNGDRGARARARDNAPPSSNGDRGARARGRDNGRDSSRAG